MLFTGRDIIKSISVRKSSMNQGMGLWRKSIGTWVISTDKGPFNKKPREKVCYVY